MSQGYIKLHRKIVEHDLYFAERFTKIMAFIDLLILAAHKPHMVHIRGIEIDLKRGQLCYSMQELGRRWKWNEKTVKKFLKKLSKIGEISFKVENRITIISITNYDLDQNGGEQNGKQNGNQNTEKTATYNKEKNVNNVKTTTGVIKKDSETMRKLTKWFSEMEDVRDPIRLAKYYIEKFGESICTSSLKNSSCMSRTKFGELCIYYEAKKRLPTPQLN